MSNLFDKNFKDSKQTKVKGFIKGPIKKKRELKDDIESIKLDPLAKPKKKHPKNFFIDDDDEIEFRIK
ncbi:MAG TPA: hypothetical protein VK590_15225 [Saprospiraceae bacterium]|nr:hypothetical protein [Saprospiraceae bacterium]